MPGTFNLSALFISRGAGAVDLYVRDQNIGMVQLQEEQRQTESNNFFSIIYHKNQGNVPKRPRDDSTIIENLIFSQMTAILKRNPPQIKHDCSPIDFIVWIASFLNYLRQLSFFRDEYLLLPSPQNIEMLPSADLIVTVYQVVWEKLMQSIEGNRMADTIFNGLEFLDCAGVWIRLHNYFLPQSASAKLRWRHKFEALKQLDSESNKQFLMRAMSYVKLFSYVKDPLKQSEIVHVINCGLALEDDRRLAFVRYKDDVQAGNLERWLEYVELLDEYKGLRELNLVDASLTPSCALVHVQATEQVESKRRTAERCRRRGRSRRCRICNAYGHRTKECVGKAC